MGVQRKSHPMAAQDLSWLARKGVMTMMARKRAKGLTERQMRILEVLERFQNQNGYPPSIREICEKANISSTSVVNYYLNQLEEWGYISTTGASHAASA